MKVLVVVDMQNDFIDGSLGTKEARSIVLNVIKKIEASKNELVLFTKDTHTEGYLNTQEGSKLPVKHCIEGTDGWEINKDVFKAWLNNSQTIKNTGLTDNTIKKNTFGSVTLAEFLKEKAGKIEAVEFIGLCTDICVISNAMIIKAFMPEVKIIVDAACCAGVTLKSHENALNAMRMCQIDIIND